MGVQLGTDVRQLLVLTKIIYMQYTENYCVRTRSGDYLTTKGTWAQLSGKTAYYDDLFTAKDALGTKRKGYIVANVVKTSGVNNLTAYSHTEEVIN